jgi:hypothetical protein
VAVCGRAGRHFDPAFADAVFLYVKAFLVIEADADVVLEHGGHMVRAAWVYGQMVGQGGGGGNFGHEIVRGFTRAGL